MLFVLEGQWWVIFYAKHENVVIYFNFRVKMDKIKISDFLNGASKKKTRATCKACKKLVTWTQAALASHKRVNCPGISKDDKGKLAKRPHGSSLVKYIDDQASQQESASNSSFGSILSDEKMNEIDMKVTNFFFRTGISFKLVESNDFKELVQALNPEYFQQLPKVDALRGRLLDEQYKNGFQKIEAVLEVSSNLTLVSDGWTNVRGDHIVNFCIKSPNNKPFFYKSINTSGVRQDAQAVTDEIVTIIEELGPEKFCSVVTDNAPVMKAAWKLIEEKFSHISANGCAAHNTYEFAHQIYLGNAL